MNEINIEKAMRNVLQILQTQPENYKRFGIYWWTVKALLKQYYNQDNIYLLGNYVDDNITARVPDADTQALLKMAFEEYTHNTAYGRDDKTVEDTEGEIVTIYDEDAGL